MNRKVLIVDDERSIVDILRYNLEKNDMTAICAYDGVEGLRLARESDPDVILLDVMLPGMDGFDDVDNHPFRRSVQSWWTPLRRMTR